MTLNPDYLPSSIVELIDVVGQSAAEAIVARRGGVTLCVPKQVSQEHWLYGAIGPEKFEDLVNHYNGEEIEIPRCHLALQQVKQQLIVEAKLNGARTVDLALEHGYSARGIRDIVQRHRDAEPDNQLDIFGEPE